jgi:hypothetical protein
MLHGNHRVQARGQRRDRGQNDGPATGGLGGYYVCPGCGRQIPRVTQRSFKPQMCLECGTIMTRM